MPSRYEWVHLTHEQLTADPALEQAVEGFRAPDTPGGAAAESWLKERALEEMEHIATYLLLAEDELAAFYSLGMSEVVLQTRQRKTLRSAHPRQGAVLILWLARAEGADVDAEAILKHAVGIGQIAARRVGAAVIALDPYDAAAEELWRVRFGFHRSSTPVPGPGREGLRRLWKPLFPEG